MADFEPQYPAGYHIPRDTVVPSLSLQRRVWPELDGWRAAHMGWPDAREKLEPTFAGGAFLELLDQLRTVLLQVSDLPGFWLQLHRSSLPATQSLFSFSC